MSPEQPMNNEQPPPDAVEQQEAEPALQPRIWVASLTDYYNGVQHGAWIDAAQEEAALQADIDTMLAASPRAAESGEPVTQWSIQEWLDFGECNLLGLRDLGLVSRIGRGIAEHGLAFAAWACLIEHPERLEEFSEAYIGHYDSLHAYLEQLINDIAYDRIMAEALPAKIRPYVKIDITATVNNLLLGGDLQAVPASDGGVWIFK
jgi:antirestriction protein